MTGYCATCWSIVDLDADGLLARHGYSIHAKGTYQCPEVKPSPMPDTPEVEEAAFRTTHLPGTCPGCGTPDEKVVFDGVYARHYARGAGTVCRFSYTHA